MFKFLKIKWILLFALGVIFFVNGVVFALNTILEGYQVNYNSTTEINAHGVCAKVTNKAQSPVALFVPTNSTEEWSAFRNNLPVGVTLANCCTVSSWTPEINTVCSGQSFTQTSNCGTTRTATGTKTCCIVTNTTSYKRCSGTSVYWYNNCGGRESLVTSCSEKKNTQYSNCGSHSDNWCSSDGTKGSYWSYYDTYEYTGLCKNASCETSLLSSIKRSSACQTDISCSTGTHCEESMLFVYCRKNTTSCTVTSWTPATNTVCNGQSFTQTSNCGTTRTATGTKDCCTVTNWTPATSTVCNGQSFTQTSNCGTTRTVTGTKYCRYVWNPRKTTCQPCDSGDLFCSMGAACNRIGQTCVEYLDCFTAGDSQCAGGYYHPVFTCQ